MGVAGGAFTGFGSADIDIIGRREHVCVFAVRHFVIVQTETLVHTKPGIVDEHRDRAVVPMIIDWPLREDDTRLFGFQQPVKLIIVRGIHHSLAVDLVCKLRLRLQNLAGPPRFGDANRTAFIRSFAGASFLAPVEIKQRDFVPQVGISGDGTAAAIFGIARVAAGHYDLQLLCGGLVRQKLSRHGRNGG